MLPPHIFDDGTAWFEDGRYVMDRSGVRRTSIQPPGRMAYSRDGHAWVVSLEKEHGWDIGLYVITPEAMAAVE